MKALRQMGGGLIIAIVSLLLVVGGIALSLAETSSPLQNTPTPLPAPTQIPDLFAATSTNVFILPTDIVTDTPAPLPTDTFVLPTACSISIPAGWFQIIVNGNDTLYTISERYKTNTDQLSAVNCLSNTNPPAGSALYVPPVPTVTVIPCGAPFGWVKTHIVQSGDNLFRIALSYGITYPQLQRANCMGSSTTIYAGQLLWVPNIPTLTVAVTSTNTPMPATNTPNPTSTTELPTSTLMPTNTPEPSTPTSTSTTAPQPSSTTAVTPSLTPFPTQTNTSAP